MKNELIPAISQRNEPVLRLLVSGDILEKSDDNLRREHCLRERGNLDLSGRIVTDCAVLDQETEELPYGAQCSLYRRQFCARCCELGEVEFDIMRCGISDTP